jgi:TolB-like protein
MKNIFLKIFLLALLFVNITYAEKIKIAILNFKVNSPTSEFNYLGEGITEMLITNLSQYDTLQIVERERLEKVVSELKLGQTGLLNENDAQKVGNIVGADLMILGSITKVGEKIRIDSHLLEVKSGKILKAQKASADNSDAVFDMIDELTEKIASDFIVKKEQTVNKDSPRIDLVFILDSTGSMGDEISRVKQKIKDIMESTRKGIPPPDVRIAIVDYKDRGDPYVVKKFDFSRNINDIQKHLDEITASGGGDTPESVNEALHVALNDLNWDLDTKVTKLVFLIGDAPPHLDYSNDYDYKKEIEIANKKSISIHTIGCSGISELNGKDIFQEIAKKTNGNYADLMYRETYTSASGDKKVIYKMGTEAYVAYDAPASESASEKGTAGIKSKTKKEVSKPEDDIVMKETARFMATGKPEAPKDSSLGMLKSLTTLEKSKNGKPKSKESDIGTTSTMVSGSGAGAGVMKGYSLDKSEPDNNLDLIVSEVIKNEAKKKGVVYERPVIVTLFAISEGKDIEISTTDEKVAKKFKEFVDNKKEFWVGGHVVPKSDSPIKFNFDPNTIIIDETGRNIASSLKVSINKIISNPEYYEKYGLMNPSRWFIKVNVKEVRG